MKIYTKKGDDGTTSLIGGERVAKNHPRVEAYGDVDELISSLGVVVSLCNENNITQQHREEIKKDLLRIQKVLMFVAAYFATPEDGSKKEIKESDSKELEWLEEKIDKLTEQLPQLKAFVLPSSPIQSAYCHVARTICRRCERRSLLVTAANQQVTANIQFGRKYLNRLSDFLFTLSRYFCHITQTPEEFWLP